MLYFLIFSVWAMFISSLSFVSSSESFSSGFGSGWLWNNFISDEWCLWLVLHRQLGGITIWFATIIVYSLRTKSMSSADLNSNNNFVFSWPVLSLLTIVSLLCLRLGKLDRDVPPSALIRSSSKMNGERSLPSSFQEQALETAVLTVSQAAVDASSVKNLHFRHFTELPLWLSFRSKKKKT